jgi:hypothetical protein
MYKCRVGFLGKLFGKKDGAPEPQAEEAAPEPDWPDAVIVLRRGMNLPKDDYVKQVVEAALPGIPESVQRFGLSQPSWFKTDEVADAIASGVAETFAAQLGLGDATHRRRVVDGPEGCACLVIELRRG